MHAVAYFSTILSQNNFQIEVGQWSGSGRQWSGSGRVVSNEPTSSVVSNTFHLASLSSSSSSNTLSGWDRQVVCAPFCTFSMSFPRLLSSSTSLVRRTCTARKIIVSVTDVILLLLFWYYLCFLFINVIDIMRTICHHLRSTCHHREINMSSSWDQYVIIVRSMCHYHEINMSLSWGQCVIIMRSMCHYHEINMSSFEINTSSSLVVVHVAWILPFVRSIKICSDD